MAVLHSTLLRLGLFLYLLLHFSSARSINYSENCTAFDEIIDTNHTGITAHPNVSESNIIYTVWVPVSDKTTTVVLQALDKNKRSLGHWQGADKECNDSAEYQLTGLNHTLFKATWIAPRSEDLTEVELRSFAVDLNRTATFSSLTLGDKEITTTLPFTSRNSPTTMSITTETTPLSTMKTTPPPTMKTTPPPTMKTTPAPTTKTTPAPTTKSFAIRTLSSPLVGAIHILVVFLISKLLF